MPANAEHNSNYSSHDLIFKNATILDGSGAARFSADLAVTGDTIAAVGDLNRADAATIIDAAGLMLTPGFIDSHSHDDFALLAEPDLECKVSQGVTTVVTGNCGVSLAPRRPDLQNLPPMMEMVGNGAPSFRENFSAYFKELATKPPAVNVVALVGHTTLRWATMDRLDREATPDEVTAMQGLLEEALGQGAAGLSTGLYYQPAQAATPAELTPLAQILGGYKGIYASHIRDEAEQIIPALEEAFNLGRRGQVPVVISHHKVFGKANFGRTLETLDLLEKTGRDQPLGLDVYPYTAASTELAWQHVEKGCPTSVAYSRTMPQAAGRNLYDLAQEKDWSLKEAVEKLRPGVGIYYAMHEDDLRRVLAFPGTMIGSDGLPGEQMPHPRLWGTFPRVLGRYCREVGLLSFEEAVHKMTALPARRWGLKGRGFISPGAKADLVLFDPNKVIDLADYAQPPRPAQGIKGVWVNGVLVWDGQMATGRRPGTPLRRGTELTNFNF